MPTASYEDRLEGHRSYKIKAKRANEKRPTKPCRVCHKPHRGRAELCQPCIKRRCSMFTDEALAFL